MEYRVQFANHRSEKNGDEVTDEIMTLEEARSWISSHPRTEYVVLQRTADVPGALWSRLPRENES